MPGYISEFRYWRGTSVEFIELAIPTGTDTSGYSVEIYDSDSTVAHTYSIGSVDATISGSDLYVVDSETQGLADLDHGQAIALVNDEGEVEQFVSYRVDTVSATSGPAKGLTSTDVGTARSGRSLQSDDGGNTYYTKSSFNSGTIPCYAPDTLIGTPDGPQRVDFLRPGDLAHTLDHGPQVVRWVHTGDHPLERAETEAEPVLIAAGALGVG